MNVFFLQGCIIEDEWVGLRPARTPLRLESEIIKLDKGTLKVIPLKDIVGLGLWSLFNATFINIMLVSFIGGGNRNITRKSKTCLKSMTNFII